MNKSTLEYQGQPLDPQPAVDLDEWQPMKTVPRTGDYIEAWHVHEECVVTVQRPRGLPWQGSCGGAWYAETEFSAWRRQSKGPQL